MPKSLIIVLFLILQSCRTAKNVRVPSKYPINIHFNDPCCGTIDATPICNFMTEFLKNNRIKKMLVLYSSVPHTDNSYTLYFPLNNFKRSLLASFIFDLNIVAKKMNPESEWDSRAKVLEKVNLSNFFTKRMRKFGHWSLVNYDSTMKCSSWSMLKPLAGSPDMMKK